jgi:NADPH2:quinone reductase
LGEAQAIVLREFGGPEQLTIEPVSYGEPGPGELAIRQTAIGVNFHDIYVRTGQYRTLALPGVPGVEAVGVVEAVGPDVADWAPGDRLAYVARSYGGYATARLLPAALAFRLPAGIEDATAAALMVRGLTVEMLIGQVHALAGGETVLIHAAAGGVGRLLVRAAKQAGARVLATVGSDEKARIAAEAGADETILYRSEDFVARVQALTDGGVDVVYDSVGADTVPGSLRVLRPCGHLVIFGQSSGPPPAIEVATLAAKSLMVSRPILFDYLDDPVRARAMSEGLYSALEGGRLIPPRIMSLPLARAAEAHRLLESREPHDAVVLIP